MASQVIFTTQKHKITQTGSGDDVCAWRVAGEGGGCSTMSSVKLPPSVTSFLLSCGGEHPVIHPFTHVYFSKQTRHMKTHKHRNRRDI